MASISSDAAGRRTIQFLGGDGKRYSVRLGKAPMRIAQEVRLRIEHILVSKAGGLAMDAETARWVARLDGTVADRLAAVALIPRRERPLRETLTLAKFIDELIEGRPTMKPNTRKNYDASRRKLVDFFGPDRVISAITAGDCDEWHADQVAQGYAPATIGRDVKRAKQFFRAAVRKKLIAENPFAEIKAAAQVNKARQFFVTQDTAQALLDACPDAEWRLIVALARYGGLRTPSETYALRWGDIDWDRGRMRVPSPKTAHNPGGDSRIIPLFPELRTHLEAVFDAAEPGTEFVIAKNRGGSGNLRTQLEWIICRAGLKQWPRLFQNMRASRETELTREHPLHVVVAWIGNSAPIAAKHYLQVTDDDFSKACAVQNPVQQAVAEARIDSQVEKHKEPQGPMLLDLATPCDLVNTCSVPPRGVEPRFSD